VNKKNFDNTKMHGMYVKKNILMFQSLLACHPGGIRSHTILNIPEYISDEAKSFLKEVSLLHCGSYRPEYEFYEKELHIHISKNENSVTD
jgi:hypothetical protein